MRAVVFDIGGVLEITPATGWVEHWESRLRLSPGAIGAELGNVWHAGSLGRISLADVEARVSAALGLDRLQCDQFMADLWADYLGSLNQELADYFASLRPRYRTGILSNSFVGAREKEQAAYGFHRLCDLIVYSHEEGLAKPDPRFYSLACERLGVRAEEVVFLDDSDVCIRGARDLGMHAIRFLNNAQAMSDIAAALGEPEPANQSSFR